VVVTVTVVVVITAAMKQWRKVHCLSFSAFEFNTNNAATISILFLNKGLGKEFKQWYLLCQ
jgi:hypothetical protein